MRIVCVIGPFLPVPPLRGGAVERIQLALCQEFAALGHDVTMVSRRHPGLPDDETRDGVRHIRIPSFDAPRQSWLYRALDVVYALRASRAAPAADVTVTNSVSLPLILSKRKAGAIYVNVGRFPKGQMGLYGRVARLQAVSRAVATAIAEQSPKVARLVAVIANPLSARFAAAIGAPATAREKRIVYVGRVAREKGVDLLVRGFATLAGAHPDWRLTIVGPHEAAAGGDGAAYRDELVALAAGHASRVDLPGPTFEEGALVEVLRSSGIFVYPSVAAKGESFGLAPLEAMACGCPVVVSRLACFTDFATAEVNCLDFDHEHGAVEGLAAQIERLIASPDLRERLARAATETARDYRPEGIAKEFIADFEALRARA